MLISVYVDKSKVSELASHMRVLWDRGVVDEYLERSPEVVTLREVYRCADLSLAIKCVLLVCLNAFDLRGFRYGYSWGEDALWAAVRDAVLSNRCRDLQSVCAYVASHVNMPQARRELLQQVARALNSTLIDEIISDVASRRLLDVEKTRRVIREALAKARVMTAHRLPVDKTVTILSRAVKKVLNVEIRGRPVFPVEIHIAKLSLRLGLVKVESHLGGPADLPLMTDTIRNACKCGWNEVEKTSGVPMWLASSMLWQVGRLHCSFDDVAPRRCQDCVFSTVCDSRLSRVSLRIVSKPEARVVLK